jgi:DNA-directed RNA polymerase specialized sigma24 family protein
VKPSPSDEKQICIAFEIFCKKTIYREFFKCKREMQAEKRKQVYLSDTAYEPVTIDEYFSEYFFTAAGDEFIVKDDYIAEALSTLPKKQIEILLLAYYLVISDEEIGEKLDMVRSTVQYHRTAALKKLRKKLEKKYEKD